MDVGRAYYSNPRKVWHFNKKATTKEGFRTYEEIDALSRYAARYKDNPELLKHMYHKYYLPKVDGETREFLAGIEEAYGTKIFLSEPLSKSQKLLIQEEFKSFKDAGLTDLPPVMNINEFEPFFLETPGSYGASLYTKGKIGRYVILKSGDELSEGAMRHEFIHQFDKNSKSLFKRFISLFVPKAKPNAKEIEEMRTSGLHGGHIQYAKTETADFVAVAGQLDATKYSKEFGERLVKLGLPREVLSMKPISLEKYLYPNFTKPEDLKLLEEIKATNGGKLPLDLQMALIDKPELIENTRNLLNINCSSAAKQRIQKNIGIYTQAIEPATYQDAELVKLLDLKRGDEAAYELYQLQAVMESHPKAIEAFKKYAAVPAPSGNNFLGEAFIGLESPEQVQAAERLLNIEVNGAHPYQEDISVIRGIVQEIKPQKLDKAVKSIEKDAQAGKVRNLEEYLTRYLRLRHRLRQSQPSQAASKIFGADAGSVKVLSV